MEILPHRVEHLWNYNQSFIELVYAPMEKWRLLNRLKKEFENSSARPQTLQYFKCLLVINLKFGWGRNSPCGKSLNDPTIFVLIKYRCPKKHGWQ